MQVGRRNRLHYSPFIAGILVLSGQPRSDGTHSGADLPSGLLVSAVAHGPLGTSAVRRADRAQRGWPAHEPFPESMADKEAPYIHFQWLTQVGSLPDLRSGALAVGTGCGPPTRRRGADAGSGSCGPRRASLSVAVLGVSALDQLAGPGPGGTGPGSHPERRDPSAHHPAPDPGRTGLCRGAVCPESADPIPLGLAGRTAGVPDLGQLSRLVLDGVRSAGSRPGRAGGGTGFPGAGILQGREFLPSPPSRGRGVGGEGVGG